jgi:hypothetical protein
MNAGGGGVTQIIAGTNVVISPTDGLGAVTISSTGGGGSGAGANVTASFTNQSTWTFTHALGNRGVVVQTFNTSWNQTIPQSITLTDNNTATIIFPSNQSGYAIASLGGVATTAATASYVLNAVSASYAATSSYVTNLNQAVTIGNITSTPSSEATLNVYPPMIPGTGEGGQILLAASGGLYTSASMLDTYQNYFRVLRGSNTGGSNAQLLGLDLQTGNLSIAGAVIPSVWAAGDVIQMRAFKPGDSGVYAIGTAGTSTSNETFFSCSFTPKSTTSYVVVGMSAKYEPAGGGADDFFSTLTINGPSGTEIGFSYQKFSAAAGADRSGVLFPLLGRYTNSSTSVISVCANVRRGTADDSIAFDSGNPNSMTMTITEIAR